MNKLGIALCLLLILAAPYLADWIDWAIILKQDMESAYLETLPFSVAFQAIPGLVEEGYIDSEMYWSNLGQLYLFTVVGAAGTVIQYFKGKK